MKPLFLKAAAAALIVAGLVAPAHSAELKAVASFSILADIAQNVGGERVAVQALIGANQDGHGYQPRPSDARAVDAADVVLVNGLGFDGWLERLAASGGAGERVRVVADGIAPLAAGADEGEGEGEGDEHAGHYDHDHDHGHADEHEHDDHDHGPLDPHAWQDVSNVLKYAENIAAAFSAADPAGAADYAANLERYSGELRALDAEIRAAFSAIPAERRIAVTAHNAFAYYGKAYGVRFIGTRQASVGTDASAANIASLVRELRAQKAAVVFLENIYDRRQMESISRESGARIGGVLHSDALSAANGGAPTYLDMMRSNTRALVEGMRLE